ncbi:MAG: putative zinc-binding metallopeptidase [Planctomycetaceae bacterium]
MRTFQCSCRNPVFFDNSQCLACGKELGFCPVCQNLVDLRPDERNAFRCGNPGCGTGLLKCDNYALHNVCNRCVPESAGEGALCDCCRFNDTIPDLSVPGNLQKWGRLEAAKRRLFYDLCLLSLPYGQTADQIDPPLTFDFKADIVPDHRSWRSIGRSEKVFTGHANGRITINIREADDVEREKARISFGEAQRTLIGHFRHEIGHYYWDQLVKGRREEECRTIFGDHDNPSYADAIETYYQQGPPADWPTRFISAYAAMHPWEDFAETWATYLDMVSTLDTMNNLQSDAGLPHDAPIEQLVARYQKLGVLLNEINRGVGLLDVVPEVFVPPVIEKLRFIQHLVELGRAENGAIGGTPGAVLQSASPA